MPPRKSATKPQLRNVAALLNREPTDQSEGQSAGQPKEQPEGQSGGIEPAATSIAIDKIQLPAAQPRRFFDADKLAQLIESVKAHGILEPLLVRPLPDGTYELVAGERRLRAAQAVGLTTVPIVVHELDDRMALQVALMENLQREDLNPIEETDAVLDLLGLALEAQRADVVALFYQAHHAKHRGQELGQNVLSQLEIVQTVMAGIGRFNIDSFRSSRLALLKLPDDVLAVLRQGKLEYTKGQAIARVKDSAQRAKLLKQAVAKHLSLNEIKAMIKTVSTPSAPHPEKGLLDQLSEISKRLQKQETLGNQKKRDRIVKLLNELEKLTADPA